MTDSLERRIEQVEQRLVARERQLQQRWQVLGLRVQRATAPRRLVGPVLAASLALLTAGWLLRRLGGRRTVAITAPRVELRPSATPRLLDPLAWVRGAAWLWPLLPTPWRARAGPGTTLSLVVAIGLPLAERLLRRRAPD